MFILDTDMLIRHLRHLLCRIFPKRIANPTHLSQNFDFSGPRVALDYSRYE